jgi:hypothetical protein
MAGLRMVSSHVVQGEIVFNSLKRVVNFGREIRFFSGMIWSRKQLFNCLTSRSGGRLPAGEIVCIAVNHCIGI